jgi:hypothetical protein
MTDSQVCRDARELKECTDQRSQEIDMASVSDFADCGYIGNANTNYLNTFQLERGSEKISRCR